MAIEVGIKDVYEADDNGHSSKPVTGFINAIRKSCSRGVTCTLKQLKNFAWVVLTHWHLGSKIPLHFDLLTRTQCRNSAAILSHWQ